MTSLPSFIGACLAIIVVPGPDLVLLLRNSAAGGCRAATATAGGIMVGNVILATAAVAGLTALFQSSTVLYHLVRLAGAAYLVVLGIQSLAVLVRQKGSPHDDATQRSSSPVAERPDGVRSFRQGLLSNLLNPKVAAFYLALFPQFTLPGIPALAQHAILATVFCVLALGWYATVLALLARIHGWLQHRRVQKGISGTSGIVLLGLGMSLVLKPKP